MYTFRLLTMSDESLVWRMLAEAAHEASVAAVRGQPELARYAEGWGREGDLGIGAFDAAADGAVGAGWIRQWPEGMGGFAMADRRLPELALGVLPDHRGRGVGTELLRRIIQSAQGRYPGIALSVRNGNPVAQLYARLGFRRVVGTETINRAGTLSYTMTLLF